MQPSSELLPTDASQGAAGFKKVAVRQAPRSRGRVFMERGAIDLDIDMTRRMLRQGQARALVIGPEQGTRAIIRALHADFHAPILNVRPGDGLTLPAHPGTVVIHDVSTLDTAGQARLLRWVQLSPRGTSVIAISSEPLFPLVQRRSFLPDLFYRLNLIVIDVTDAYAIVD